jgi:hypothetical protein
MFWRRGYTLRGEVGGGWALEFPSFLGPVKWHRADRRVPFHAGKNLPGIKSSGQFVNMYEYTVPHSPRPLDTSG